MQIKYVFEGKEYDSLYPLRKTFPHVSFPASPTSEQLAELGIEVIEIPGPEPTLDELKAAKKAEIANVRWNAQTANIAHDGSTYHADENATANIHAAVTAALSGNREWKTADGKSVKLNANKLKNLFVAIEERKEGGFVKEAELTAQIDACQTAEEVASIVWE